MVKGCERRVVIYKCKESKYFYEAHFIMKDGLELGRGKKSDIIAEANRIVGECSFDKSKGKKKRQAVFRITIFALSFLSGFLAHLLLSHLF